MIRRLAISIRLSFASVPTKELHVIVELAGFRLLTFRPDASTLLMMFRSRRPYPVVCKNAM